MFGRCWRKTVKNCSESFLLNLSNRSYSAKPTKSPIVTEYFNVKSLHPDSLLLYQIGDFYEIFGKDALLFSSLADVQLCRTDRRGFPMTGVPVRSIEMYASRILKKGLSLAIYDQVVLKEGEGEGKIERKFTKLITPASFSNEENDFSSKNILSISLKKDSSFPIGKLSLAWGDLFSGNLEWTDCEKEEFFRLFSILNPVEVIYDAKLEEEFPEIIAVVKSLEIRCNPFSPANENAQMTCKNNLFIDDVIAPSSSAIPLLTEYLRDNNICSAPVFSSPRYFNASSTLLLDSSCLNALEIFSSFKDNDKSSSLFSSINSTLTAGGSRLLYQRLRFPSVILSEINFRLDFIDSFKNLDTFLLDEIREILKTLPDTERHVQRILANKPTGTLQSMKKVQIFLENSKELFALLQGNASSFTRQPCLEYIQNSYFDFDVLLNAISQAIVDDPPARTDEDEFIRPSFDIDLDSLRAEYEGILSGLQLLQLRYRQETGVMSLKVVSDKKTLGWFIESQHPINNPSFHLESSTARSHRYRTKELDSSNKRHNSLSDTINDKQLEIYSMLRQMLIENSSKIKALNSVISEIDVAVSMANYPSFTRPSFIKNLPSAQSTDPDDCIHIENGFHPVIAKKHSAALKNFVTNSASFSPASFWLITGPNMGGKSTFLRQTAIISLMAQAGLPVPAAKAHLKVFDGIFCRIGAADDIAKNQSTFMVEMQEMADIFSRTTSDSLVLLDEVGRGTSYLDGLSLTVAICNHLKIAIKPIVLFATHYHELTHHLSQQQFEQYKSNAFIDENGRLIFSYKIVPGNSDESFGIEVAALAGFPDNVIREAKLIKSKLQNNQSKGNSFDSL